MRANASFKAPMSGCQVCCRRALCEDSFHHPGVRLCHKTNAGGVYVMWPPRLVVVKLHNEVRQRTVLTMSADPGVLRLTEVPALVPPEKEGRPCLTVGDSGGRMIGTKSTMAGIASAGALLREDVYDETG